MSKRYELAAVLGEHSGWSQIGPDGAGEWTLICHDCGMVLEHPLRSYAERGEGADDAAMAQHQADAVRAWLGEQFDEGLREAVARALVLTHADTTEGYWTEVADDERAYWLSQADAALATVRTRLGLSDAAQDAQDGAVGPGSARVGTGEGAGPNGAQIEDFEGDR